MQLNVPPDLETLIRKRLSTGGYADAEDVLRRALQAQDAEESWTDEERNALAAHIEEGYRQAERGELIDGATGPPGNSGDEAELANPQGMSLYVLTSLAKADIFNIWSYIADRNKGAAERVEQSIYDACAFVAEAPMRGHSRSDLTHRLLRFWTLTRYPAYSVVYRPDVVPIQVVALSCMARGIYRVFCAGGSE